jgi:hypothetical protein
VRFVVAGSFRIVEDDSSWAFVGVYGPNIDTLRRSLWDKLPGLLSWWDFPWCVVGDFNVTRFPWERSGVNRLSPAITDFFDFISEQARSHGPSPYRGSFTWSNNSS